MALKPGNSLSREEKRAQQQAAQDDVLLREVDDAVRQDQYADFSRKYGRPLLAIVVVGLLAFGGYLWWREHREGQYEADSETFVSALDKVQAGDLASGDKGLAPVIEDGEPGAAASAQLLKAGIAMEQGKTAEAGKLFDAVAADASAPQTLRDLATVRAVAANYDKMKSADVVSRLQPLVVPDKPWFPVAGEMLAMAYLDQGKNAEAGKLFAQIVRDKNTSETLKSRARQMAGLLGVDAIDDVDKVLKEQEVGAEMPGGAGAPRQ
ncbi:MAG: tetratricopeptide repeat protein [Tsuneonella suprasediminis]